MTRRNPPVVPADTTPEAWRVQIAAVRALTPAERICQWEKLNDALIEMELDAFRRLYPDLDEHQRFLIRMRLRYGAELAAEVWPESVDLVG